MSAGARLGDGRSRESTREPILNPVDRIMEMLFGLLMALSFTGAVSVAESGREEMREMFIAALGCNLAWGLVDARHVPDPHRHRSRPVAHARALGRERADAQAGRALIESSLSRVAAGLVSPTEIEAIRGRIVALPSLPARPR